LGSYSTLPPLEDDQDHLMPVLVLAAPAFAAQLKPLFANITPIGALLINA
jgi:hypothetical protein